MYARIRPLQADGHLTVHAGCSDLPYAMQNRMSGRDRLLGELEAVTPGSVWVAAIQPLYPKDAGQSRPPSSGEHRPPMAIAQPGFGPAGQSIEYAPFDSPIIWGFVGIGRSRE